MDITKDLFEKMPPIEIDLDEENKDLIKEIVERDLDFKVPIWPHLYDPSYGFCLEINQNTHIHKWHRLNCFERVLADNLFCFSGSEYNQVSLWDIVVRFTIQDYFKYHDLKIEIDRNKAYEKTTATLNDKNRPDFLLKYRGYLLFKGEEKAQVGAKYFQEAKLDLIKKEQHFDFDLLACYAAAGSQFQLYFLVYKDNSLFPISPELDLNFAEHRLKAVILILNICRVLHYQIIIIDEYIKLENGIKRDHSHSTIEFELYRVKKQLNFFSILWNFENCQHVWRELIAKKNINGIVKCYSADWKKGIFQIETKKLENRFPIDAKQLLHAIRDITSGLKYLHDNGYVHTDLKWSNVLFKQGTYYLIDFDKCLKINHVITRSFPNNHCLRLKSGDIYTIQEDFCQIGFEIIGNCGLNLNEELIQLKIDLEDKVFENADKILTTVINLIDNKKKEIIIID